MDKKLLFTSIVFLVVGLAAGYGFGYLVNMSQIQALETRISNLEIEKNSLISSYNALDATHSNLLSNYTWVKQHSFTYYEVGNAINISSLEIEEPLPESVFRTTKVRGNITNISNKSLKEVYVYVILRNQDGTMYFGTSDYEEIKDLYIGETANFEIWVYSYTEGQTVEFWLLY